METLPFDPAEFLDTEDAIAAYLADARLDGAVALARAVEVVTRARARMRQEMSASVRSVAEGPIPGFSHD